MAAARRIPLLFVANRLLESNDPDDNALGRGLRDEVGLNPFAPIASTTCSSPFGQRSSRLAEGGSRRHGTNRDHYVVNIYVEDHQDFIAAMYQEAEDLGDD